MKRTCPIVLILMTLTAAMLALPAYAGESDHPWTIYFHPGVRFGTDNRTLYIMDFLVPLYQGDKNILFFNPRFTPNDQDGWETNLGFGYRHLLFNDKLILGGNFYYDRRHTGWGTNHEQIGFGFEAMTEINRNLALTARFNYYIPMSDAIVANGITGTPLGYYLEEDGIYQIYDDATLTRTVEEPLGGYDGEIGVRVPFVSDYVETWVYGGGYHYWGNYIEQVNGWTARLELVPTDFVKLSYEYRYDNISHGEHYGEVMFEIPFSIENLYAGKNPFAGIGKRFSGSRALPERLTEPVRRDVDVNVKTKFARDYVGNGYHWLSDKVVFVSDLGSNTTGDGTQSNPYRTIGMAQANLGTAHTIHVMFGSGGLLGSSIVYTSNLTIWGAGAPNPNVVLVNFTPGSYPNLGNLWVSGVSNVLITGLNFRSEGFHSTGGIDGGHCGIFVEDNKGGIVIKDNHFNIIEAFDPFVYGIIADGSVGSGKPIVIEHNEIHVENVTMLDDQTYGVFLFPAKNGVVTGVVRDNGIYITSATNYDSRTFALGAVGYGELVQGMNYDGRASVGSDAYPLIFDDNNGYVSFTPGGSTSACGMIYTAPPGGGYELNSYLLVGPANYFAYPNGTAGCNYPGPDGNILDPFRYPTYIH
jgi:hypothetical protein